MIRMLVVIILLGHGKQLSATIDSAKYYIDHGIEDDKKGNHNLAIEKYNKALEFDNRNDAAYYNMSLAYYYLRNYDYALQYAKLALSLTEPENKVLQSYILNLIATIYINLAYYEKAIQSNIKSHNIFPNSAALTNISFSYLEMGRMEEARKYFQKSILNQPDGVVFYKTVLFASNVFDTDRMKAYQIIKDLVPAGNYRNLSNYYFLKACEKYDARKYPEALMLFYTALQQRATFYKKAKILQGLGDTYHAIRKPDSSLLFYEQAIAKLDTQLLEAPTYLARLEIVKSQSAVYTSLIEVNLELQDTARAFYYTEKSKSAALRLNLVEKGILAEEPIPSLAAVQQSLQARDLMLEYKLLHDSLLIFEISRERLKVHYFKADSLLPLARRFINYTGFSARAVPDKYEILLADSRYLFKILFRGIAVEGKNLIIVPDERFYNLPFACLLTDDTQTDKAGKLPYLIKQNAVRYLYSAGMNGARKYRNMKMHHVFPVLPDGSRLQGGIALHKRLRSYRVQNTEGIDSTGYSFLHFDTHGLFNKDSSLYNYLILTNDSLYIHEVMDMRLNTDLVTLASCYSGYGNIIRGEGGITFDRAFIYAGANTVLTSFWQANDAATPVIFGEFYKQLRRGKSPEKALQLAQIKFLETPFRYGHSATNWANFAVVGKTGRLSWFKGHGKILLTALAGLTVIMLLFLFMKNRKKNPKIR